MASGRGASELDSTVPTMLLLVASAELQANQQSDYGRRQSNVGGELQRLECDYQANQAALLVP